MEHPNLLEPDGQLLPLILPCIDRCSSIWEASLLYSLSAGHMGISLEHTNPVSFLRTPLDYQLKGKNLSCESFFC